MDSEQTATQARRQAILDAAKLVFFEEGYPTASMDRIAERAGVTKKTVYAHFAAKHALFAAVVERACANVVAQLPVAAGLPDDPAVGLPLALHRSRDLMVSPNCIRLERIVAAEAERHPEFAATLRGAFAQGEARLADTLAAWVVAGRLKPHDTALAARMLNDQVGYGASLRGLLGGPAQDPAARAAIDQAADLFLAAYRK